LKAFFLIDFAENEASKIWLIILRKSCLKLVLQGLHEKASDEIGNIAPEILSLDTNA